MKFSIIAFAVCMAGVLTLSFTDDPMIALRNLDGAWIMKTKNGLLGETWTIKSAVELNSRGFAVRGRDTVLLETVTLIKRADGVFYESLVVDQNDGKAIPFKLVSFDRGRFVFENKDHDYPTSIIYSFITSDSLVARIEGVKNGKPSNSEFYYRRALRR